MQYTDKTNSTYSDEGTIRMRLHLHTCWTPLYCTDVLSVDRLLVVSLIHWTLSCCKRINVYNPNSGVHCFVQSCIGFMLMPNCSLKNTSLSGWFK